MLTTRRLCIGGAQESPISARQLEARWRTRPSLPRPRPIKSTATQEDTRRCRPLRARSDQKITTDHQRASPRPIGLDSQGEDATINLGMSRRTTARYNAAKTTRSGMSTSMSTRGGHGQLAAPPLLPRLPPRPPRLPLPTTAGLLPSRSTRRPPPPKTQRQQRTPLTTAPTQETVQRLLRTTTSDRASSTCLPRRQEEGRLLLPGWEATTRPALRMSMAVGVVGSERRPGTRQRAAAAQ